MIHLHSSGLEVFETALSGEARILGRLPPRPDNVTSMKSASSVYPSIDPSQYRNIDREGFFSTDFILDQNGVGGCVGWSEASAEMRMRLLRYNETVVLSGAYAYAQVNGGHDDGAVITDSMTAGQKKGICLKSTMDLPSIYLNQVPSGADVEALKYRIGAAAVIVTQADLAAALQFDDIPQIAIMVGNNFESFDSEGVSGFTPGPGNHSVHIDSMIYSTKSSRWILKIPNTWGPKAGPNKNGYYYITFQHFTGVTQQDAYVHLSSLMDSGDANAPPTPSK